MLDHSSDSNFLAYCERESVSEQMIERFIRIRDWMSVSWSERNRHAGLLGVADIRCSAGKPYGEASLITSYRNL
jgi:hypothetical protein